ncbi:DinB family protein [Planktothrix agardhii]|uniref:DinB family protein n=1 Tax=Planktothrix agardhii TaxID=1160 RepID=UPI0020A7A156|nr:DinB family protein [Planktothrix agardhii]CAD5954057.1 DinB family protein [Planktothrix agardhii]
MTHPLIAHFQLLARYNILANQRIYSACAELTDAERKQTRPAFFKSIHNTLNHIMVGDRIWMTRFSGSEMTSTGLDTILYEDFDQLWENRQIEDTKIEDFFQQFDQTRFDQTIRYCNSAGNIHDDPIDILIMHFFNHQTHHRGQIHDMLTQTIVKPPSLDMHRILRPNSTV